MHEKKMTQENKGPLLNRKREQITENAKGAKIFNAF